MTNDAATLTKGTRPTITFERQLAAPVERVWRAITDPDEMRAWFPSAVVGERKVGAPLSFPFDENVADAFEGEVTEWAPERVFAFTWNGDQLRIELTPDGDGTRLVFSQVLSHMTEAARTASGWHACLANLDAHLGGTALAPDAWRELYGDYLALMGPPMATVREQVSFEWERMHFQSPERVWECLTDPKELEGWMGSPTAIDLRVGGAVRFFEGHDPVDGVIVLLEPGRRIAYSFNGLSVVEWEVQRAERGTRYWLRQHGMNPADQAAGRAAGWHGFLTQLDMFMASGQLVVIDDWEKKTADYEKLLA
jgi:uncharacterized protein YndB with AHSA1/START domain